MPLPTWGNLEKSQEDKEKIEEAIQRLINEHNNDPNAHLGEGQSLYNHKVSEIIDHVVASIIADKIRDGEIDLKKLTAKQNILWTVFESLDGWNASSGIDVSIFGLAMQTGNVANTEKYLYAEPYGDGDAMDPSKSPFFQTSIRLSDNSNQTIYIISGSLNFDEDDHAFGFKIENGTLYAIVIKEVSGSRTEYKTEISGVTLTNWNVYRAFYDYPNNKIYFYVNGVLKHTEENHLLSESRPELFNYYIKNLVAENRVMYIKYLLWSKKL